MLKQHCKTEYLGDSEKMIVLSNEQKNKIANVVGQKGEYTFFQAQSFGASDKVRGMDDNAALWGDVAHFLAHGITFGGMLHSLGRSARWTEVSNNAYNKAISNHLKAYRARLLDVGAQMADMIQTILFYRVNAQGLGVGVPIEFEQMGYRNSEYRKNTQRK